MRIAGQETGSGGRVRVLLLLSIAAPAMAQPALYACAAFTKQYVVGAKLPASGLFRRTGSASWRHLGFNLPFLFGIDGDNSTIFLAAGNGLIGAAGGGEKWTILTGSDVTEIRDVTVDPSVPGSIVFAHTAGVRASTDAGKTWREIGGGLHRKYTEVIRVDRSHPGVLIAGNEEGIFRSEDSGATWRLAGAAGFQLLDIRQSPRDACFWLAAAQQGGLFASHDCAHTFESSGRVGVGANLYSIAFDPAAAGRIALGGWGPGVLVSSDEGKTWQQRNTGLPGTAVTAVVFDPVTAGRLFAAVHEEAVFVSGDAGATWAQDGLEGAQVTELRFLGK